MSWNLIRSASSKGNMKTIIAGSRTITDYWHVLCAVSRSGFEITEVVSGTARGVDKLGERWAECHNIPVKRFPADWSKHGKAAGHIRNAEMGDYAEALIAVTNGSGGTRNMIEYAKKKGLKVFVLFLGE
jgi:hypothetical protein